MKTFFQFFAILIIFFFELSIDLFGQGTIETRSFNSPELGATKFYRIYLPEGYYQSTDNYPVVYFFRNHEIEWINYGALHQVANELIQAGLIGKMILVLPNTGSNDGSVWGCVNMLRPDLAPFPGIGTGQFEDYIVNDLITHIDTTFRTIADKQHRGIDGFSLGGFISTAIALRNPELFSSIGSYDGTLMFYDLEDPAVPGPGPDDFIWMTYPEVDPLFDNPRNVSYMLEHSVTNILELADTSLINQFKANRYHISHGYCDGVGNYCRNKDFISKLREKGIRNSWGNPLLHDYAVHTYTMAKLHATASLIKHWQTFNGTKISAPTLIDFSITELIGKTREACVFNYGPGSLTVTGIQTNSTEFSLLDLPTFPITLIPVTDSILFTIKFSPTVYQQTYADTIYINSDDPNTPVTKMIVRGTGGSFIAEPEVFYAASSTALFTIDLNSLTVQSVGAFGSGNTMTYELSVDPITKELFGLEGPNNGMYYDFNLINTKNGNGVGYQEWMEFPTSDIIKAAKLARDTLIYTGTQNGDIFVVDFRNVHWPAPINQIASTGLSLTAFAFNPVDDKLWAAVGTNQIYTIDLSTGNTTLIGNTGLNKQIDDLTFTYEGVLYGLVSSSSLTDTLITINTSTGTATKLGALNSTYLNAIAISPDLPVGIIATNHLLPENYLLYQNYPNPFNPSTVISYQLPVGSNVSLKLYDILGNEIATLVNEEKSAGRYEITFDSHSGEVQNLPSGVYFYQLRAGEFVSTKKMILLK